MSNDGFFRRWSRLKSHGDGARSDAAAQGTEQRGAPSAGAGTSMQRADELQALDLPPLAQTAPHPPFAPPLPGSAPRSLPTIEDVAALGPNSDFSAFVSQGVDKTVQRLAMKKLFSDPHFSILDGLDVYIDDYTKADPIPVAMLASLDHAKSVFSRLLDDKTGSAAAGEQQPSATPESPAGSAPNGDQGDDPEPDSPKPPDNNNA
jgi:hypothetical protein